MGKVVTFYAIILLIKEKEKEKYLNEPCFLEPFSKEGATAVNRFFGLETVGPLNSHNLPQRIFLGNLWQENLPILKKYPLDRELYIGRDFVEGKLQVAEIVVGKQKKEIAAEDAELAEKGGFNPPRLSLGEVSHQAHLFAFHTHVLDPDMVLPKDRKERIVQETPDSGYGDLAWLVLNPKAYIQTILDIGLWDKVIVGRALVVIKTTAWIIDRRNDLSDIQKGLMRKEFLMKILAKFAADVLSDRKHKVCQMPKQVTPSSQKMILRLQSDENWCNSTGIAIYRGLVLQDANKDLRAYRWDVFYRRLMAMERKIERKRKRFKLWPFMN